MIRFKIIEGIIFQRAWKKIKLRWDIEAAITIQAFYKARLFRRKNKNKVKRIKLAGYYFLYLRK